jgi:hypothetical protein
MVEEFKQEIKDGKVQRLDIIRRLSYRINEHLNVGDTSFNRIGQLILAPPDPSVGAFFCSG